MCFRTECSNLIGSERLYIPHSLLNSAIHKAAGLSAAVQNALWRLFLPVAPIHTNGTFFSGTVE